MPTLLDLNGFKFFFYANEHEPRHIHVTKGEGFAKVNLDTMEVVHSYLKTKELKMAIRIIEEHREDFIRRWNEWFD